MYRTPRSFPALLVGAALLAGTVRAAGAGLSIEEQAVIFAQAAASAATRAPASVIAIVDRDGRELLVRRADGGPVSPAAEAIAVSKAGTAVFLSSDGEAFTTRTAGFIIQQHFPPGIMETAPGPLVGVGFSSMAYSDINSFRRLDGSRIAGSRLYGSPGGVPLYLGTQLAAGLGVTGPEPEVENGSITGPDTNEVIALTGQGGFEPPAAILATNVFIGGFRLPYVASAPDPDRDTVPPSVAGLQAPPAVVWPTQVIGGVLGEVRSPLRGDPAAGLISGQARLSQAEVTAIIAGAAARSQVTRAGIRLPVGQSAEVFISVVGNPNQAGAVPPVLGTFRTPDATIFSWDVSVQKARTALFFSDPTRAFSARTVGFLAQSHYPPGIDNEPPGPFNGLQERFAAPLLAGTSAPNGNLPNGITIFPGAFPLYRRGVLIGAVGVSGDGVDQDDLVASSGTPGFQPATAIRADSMIYLGARLPYAVFPRDPELVPAPTPVTTGPKGH